MRTGVKRGLQIVAVAGGGVIGAGLIWLHTPAFRHTVEHRVESMLSEQTGREVRFRLNRLQPLALSARITELRIAGLTPASGALLQLGETNVTARLRPLLQGRVHLSELSVAELSVDLDQLPAAGSESEGHDDSELGGLSLAELTELVRIDHGVIERGRLLYTEPQSAVRLVVADIRLELERDPAPERYLCELEAAAVNFGIPEIGDLPLSVTAQVALDAATFEIAGFTARGAGVGLEGSATLTDLVPLRGSAEVDLELEPDRLPFALPVEAAVGGAVTARGTTRFDGSDYEIELDLRSPELTWSDWIASDVGVELAGTPRTWGADLRATVLGVTVQGEIRGGAPSILVPVTASFDVSTADAGPLLRAATSGAAPALRGSLEGRLTVHADALREDAVAASLWLEAANLGPRSARDLAVTSRIEASLSKGVVVVERLEARGPGVRARARGSADLDTSSSARVDLRLERAGEALRFVRRSLDALGVDASISEGVDDAAGRLELTAALTGPGLRRLGLDTLRGELTARAFELATSADSDLPVRGEAVATVERGALTVQRVELLAPDTRIEIAGGLSVAGARDVTIDATIDGPGRVSNAVLSELRALGWPDPGWPLEQIEPLGGTLRLHGRLDGPWNAPGGNISLAVKELGLPERPTRDLVADATLDAGHIEARAELAGNDDTLSLELHGGSFTDPTRWVVDAEVLESSPEWWTEIAGTLVETEGTLEGTASVTLETGTIHASFDIRDGSVAAIPFELRDVDVTVSADELEVGSAELIAFGGRTNLAGALRDGLHLRADGLDFGRLLGAAGLELDAEGTVDLSARIGGSLTSPEISGDIAFRGGVVEATALPDLEGPLSFTDDRVAIELTEPGGDGLVRANGSLRDGVPWNLDVRYPMRIAESPFTEADQSAPDVGFQTELRAALRGRAGDPRSIRGSVEAADTILRFGPETLTAKPGPRITFADGAARLEPIELRGTATRVRAEGNLALEEPRTLALEVEGSFALGTLAWLVPDARLSGSATVDLRVAGSLDEPIWDGTAQISDARLTHPELPAPLDQMSAGLILGPERLKLENLSAKVRGGDLRGAGEYVATGPEAGAVRGELSGEAVRLELEDGLRVETDARLRLDGRVGDLFTLTGQLDIARAAFTQDFELRREFTARTRTVVGTTNVGDLEESIQLDIKAEAPSGVYIRNNIAAAEASVDVAIRGSMADPRLTGRLRALEGGRWFLRGVTYNITRATLEYVDDVSYDPRVDIRAETSVVNYDITLAVTGRAQDPVIDLTSNPPLPTADIVSLLITGRTRDNMNSSGGLSGVEAALYLTRDFTREVEASLQRSLGIDQVRFDPVLVEGDAEPAARLTLGKAITGNLFATYSTAIGGNQGNIYRLEYQPRERVSLVGRQDEDSELSGEILHNRQYYVGPPRADGPVAFAGEANLRVGGVSFHGNTAIPSRRLRRDFELNRGDRLRRSVLLSGLDEIRDLYLARGYAEARVDVDRRADGENVWLDVKINEGRKVGVVLDGLGGRRRGLRRELLRLWSDSVFRDLLADDATRLILARMRARGFDRATAAAELIERGPEETGLHVTIDRGPRIRVKHLVIEGAESVAEERIRKQLLTEEAGLFRRGRLSRELLSQDLEAIRQLYRGQGYLDVEVGEPEISYPSDDERAVVHIVIDEGRRYRIGNLALLGAEALDAETLADIVTLQQGDPLIDAEVRQLRSVLRREFDRRGYPEVRVGLRTRVDRDAATVDIDLTVNPGPHKIIESVEITGATLTRPWITEREIEVEAGEPWSADSVAATRQQIYRTGLFTSVGMHEDPGETPEGRHLRFEVEEGNNVRTAYGVGASTGEGALVRASVNHLNLFGRRIYGSIGGRASQNEWRAFSLLRQPRLFGSGLDGMLSTFVEESEEDAFKVRRIGFTTQVDGKLGRKERRWFAGYGLENSEVTQEGIKIVPGSIPPDLLDAIDLRTQSIIRLGRLNVGLVGSSMDDPVWPSRGRFWQARLSWFDEMLASEAEFLRASLQWRTHHRFGSRTMGSFEARLGVANPYGISELVPIAERFFAGGDDTIRGFRHDSIEAVGFPADELADAGIITTEALGGDVQLILRTELVRPLYGPLFAAAFYDAGNIYWQIEHFDAGNLRHGAGLGVRMRTPIGPLRLEYGWKLDREGNEDRGRIHFSLGL